MKSQTIEIKERSILFSTEMVKAILDGRKTQTRRVIKNPYKYEVNPDFSQTMDSFAIGGIEKLINNCPYGKPGDKEWQTGIIPGDGFYYVKGLLDKSIGGDQRLVYLRKFEDAGEKFITWGFDEQDDPEAIELDTNINTKNIQWKRPGDRLYVRETWHPAGRLGTEYTVEYKTGHTKVFKTPFDFASSKMDAKIYSGWQRSIFMPREFCRILLEITDIRVERVQDISENDAMAEGASKRAWVDAGTKDQNDDYTLSEHRTKSPYCYKNGFANLWNSINAKRGYGWDVNPWVWVIEFRKI